MIPRVLITQYLDESHTTKSILNILSDWNLQGKFVAVVSDNTANIVKAIEQDGCKFNLIQLTLFRSHTEPCRERCAGSRL